MTVLRRAEAGEQDGWDYIWKGYGGLGDFAAGF